METAGAENNTLTSSQREAVAARGNVLVMAGAGTGKTHTLVERCLDLICNERVSLDEMLIVTFTEAAAAEMRGRLREGLEEAAAKRPLDAHLTEQLALFDAAHIGTLHSFCFKLVREHFHALGLDPQLAVLDEAQARLLADEILDEQFQSHYENGGEESGHGSPDSIQRDQSGQPSAESKDDSTFSLAVQDLITVYGDGRDDTIRALVLRLHHYIQTRADAEAWLARQIEEFSSADPAQWREWYLKAVQEWRDEWVPVLQSLQAENVKAAECLEILEQFPTDATTSARSWSPLFRRITAADRSESYPFRKKTVLRKPLEVFFDDAEFLGSLLPDAAPRPSRDDLDSQVVDPPSQGYGAASPPSQGYGAASPPSQGYGAASPSSPGGELVANAQAALQPAAILKSGTVVSTSLPSQPARQRKSSARQMSADRNLQLDLFIGSEPDVQSAHSKTPAAPIIQKSNNPIIQIPSAPGPQLIKDDSPDPLREDWEWSRGHMKTLLLLVKEFSEKFSTRKRADGVVDFHDLEQFAIKLLAAPLGMRAVPATRVTEIAEQWRDKLRFTFVDEYQDINAAQDKIISALGADNRFLVGDVKQSIYRFRLADPMIFRNYAKDPASWNARVIPLRENFRSREGLLDFVNSVFETLMSEEIGGVPYDEQAKLKFGSPETRAELSAGRNQGPRVELLLREKKRSENAETGAAEDPLADLQEPDLEAFMVASRLRELKESGHLVWDKSSKAPAPAGRPVRWSDFAVLLRSPGSKADVYAKQFERAGVPLHVERGGFYDSREISDLLSLLQLADNPLQDVPCIAVLRSPIVGCSLDELAEIRLAAPGHFWSALNRAAAAGSGVQDPTRLKIGKFLARFSLWRQLARQASLSECLENILTETHYDDWLLSRPRGAQRRANVHQFLRLAEQFDAFQRQGLFRFLKFVEAQREIEAEPEVATAAEVDAVRLMSIHQSKGLEFPVIVLADLGKTFNEQDLRGEIILDEQFGLCPRIKPPAAGGRYPSLAYWLARKNQRRELRGEELRLLYVAMTRARDTLILSGSVSAKKWEAFYSDDVAIGLREIISAHSCMDWIGMWFAKQKLSVTVEAGAHGESPLLRWRVVDDSGAIVTSQSAGPQDGSVTCESSPPVGDSLNEGTLNKINGVLDWKYPFATAAERTAKTSVTALRHEADDEAEQRFRPPPPPGAGHGRADVHPHARRAVERRRCRRGASQISPIFRIRNGCRIKIVCR